MGSDYGSPPDPFYQGYQGGAAFASARGKKRQDQEDREYRDRTRQEDVADRLEARASADRSQREARMLRRAELATQGVRFQPNPTEVFEETGGVVDLPSLIPGASSGGTMRGVRNREGVTALGDRTYFNPEWSGAAANDRRDAAANESARERQRTALRSRGYNDQDIGLVTDAGVDPTSVGPLAAELERRARRRAAPTETDPEVAVGRRRANAEGLLRDYDTRTEQGLDYAGKLQVPDYLMTPADSAVARTRDSTLADASERVRNRPSLIDLLDPPAQDSTVVQRKTWQQRRAELLRQGKSEADIERTLTQEGYLTP